MSEGTQRGLSLFRAVSFRAQVANPEVLRTNFGLGYFAMTRWGWATYRCVHLFVPDQHQYRDGVRLLEKERARSPYRMVGSQRPL